MQSASLRDSSGCVFQSGVSLCAWNSTGVPVRLFNTRYGGLVVRITVLCLCFYTPFNVKIHTPNCMKMHNLKFSGEGVLPPPRPLPTGEGNTPSPDPTPVLDLDFCKVPPQLCDGSTLIHGICSSSSSSSSSGSSSR